MNAATAGPKDPAAACVCTEERRAAYWRMADKCETLNAHWAAAQGALSEREAAVLAGLEQLQRIDRATAEAAARRDDEARALAARVDALAADLQRERAARESLESTCQRQRAEIETLRDLWCDLQARLPGLVDGPSAGPEFAPLGRVAGAEARLAEADADRAALRATLQELSRGVAKGARAARGERVALEQGVAQARERVDALQLRLEAFRGAVREEARAAVSRLRPPAPSTAPALEVGAPVTKMLGGSSSVALHDSGPPPLAVTVPVAEPAPRPPLYFSAPPSAAPSVAPSAAASVMSSVAPSETGSSSGSSSGSESESESDADEPQPQPETKPETDTQPRPETSPDPSDVLQLVSQDPTPANLAQLAAAAPGLPREAVCRALRPAVERGLPVLPVVAALGAHDACAAGVVGAVLARSVEDPATAAECARLLGRAAAEVRGGAEAAAAALAQPLPGSEADLGVSVVHNLCFEEAPGAALSALRLLAAVAAPERAELLMAGDGVGVLVEALAVGVESGDAEAVPLALRCLDVATTTKAGRKALYREDGMAPTVTALGAAGAPGGDVEVARLALRVLGNMAVNGRVKTELCDSADALTAVGQVMRPETADLWLLAARLVSQVSKGGGRVGNIPLLLMPRMLAALELDPADGPLAEEIAEHTAEVLRRLQPALSGHLFADGQPLPGSIARWLRRPGFPRVNGPLIALAWTMCERTTVKMALQRNGDLVDAVRARVDMGPQAGEKVYEQKPQALLDELQDAVFVPPHTPRKPSTRRSSSEAAKQQHRRFLPFTVGHWGFTKGRGVTKGRPTAVTGPDGRRRIVKSKSSRSLGRDRG